ncbi:hypothetical protein Tco_1430008 [Tanacetum coccineum]
MFESRRMTIPFPSRLNDYYCDDKKELYRPQFLEANSYGASHIDNSIPRKEKDPGSFTLPCYINNLCFDNSFADLGASVSVMSLSTYLNLGLGELAHIKLMAELADRTVKYPKAIAKNVLVWIGKFVFPVDFIIIDMLEDVKVPLILGRPFLSTTHAKIDMFKRKIILLRLVVEKDGKLKEEALKNKAIMEGIIDEDDESSNEGWRRWEDFNNTNRDNEESENEMEHKDEERCEVFDDHERLVCYIRRSEMVKYSFRDDEEYVAIKENECDDLMNTRKEAIHAYQEIFCMMDE